MPKPTNGRVSIPTRLSVVASENRPLAEIPEERVHLELVIRHEEIQAAVAVVVAEVGAHPGTGLPVDRHGHARGERDLLEDAAAFVVVQKIRRHVVGHENIRPPVIVVIADDDAESVAAVRADAGGLADVSEGAVAVVVIEDRGQGSKVERVTIDAESIGRCRRRRCCCRLGRRRSW